MSEPTHERRLFESHTSTVSEQSAEQINDYWQGVLLFIDVTAISGTGPSVKFGLEGKDPVTGAWFELAATSALTTTGKRKFLVFPGVAAAADLREDMGLPKRWRINVTVAGTGPSVTYSLGAVMIP